MPWVEADHDGADRKFVATGMHAELKAVSEPEFVDGKGDDAQILVEFLFELREIAH